MRPCAGPLFDPILRLPLMAPIPLPKDEADRLESLRALGLLDTEAEERFDRITRMAQSLLDAPIALFGLVDAERVWYKSRQGFVAPENPRDYFICSRAILGW